MSEDLKKAMNELDESFYESEPELIACENDFWMDLDEDFYMGDDLEDLEEAPELEKAAARGEGSRGGKIVGHTKSGKPIYAGSKSAEQHKKRMFADKLDPNATPEQKAKARAMRHSRGIKTPEKEYKRYFRFQNEGGAIPGKKGEKVYGSKRDYERSAVGVHGSDRKEEGSVRGRSAAGINAEWGKKHKTEASRNAATDNAKKMHSKKLQELRDMPKPQLTKAEDFELLVDTIMTVGPEGLKKALPTLSDKQKELLKAVLEKAKLEGKISNKPKKVKDLDSHEVPRPEGGADSEDEELVEESMAQHRAQGGSEEKQSEQPWEGQMIKSQEPTEEKEDKKMRKSMSEMTDEQFEHLTQQVSEQGHTKEAFAEVATKEGVSTEKFEKAWTAVLEKAKMKREAEAKEEAKEEAAEKIMAMEEKEHGTKNPKKLVQAEKEEHEEKEKEPSKEDMPSRMKKSIVWNNKTEQLLKATTRRGQNAHYTVEDYLLKSEADKAETLKKGGYLNEAEETLAKSQKPSTIQDMIEKGEDRSFNQVRQEEILTKSIQNNAKALTESFDIKEIAKSMGIDEAKARELLGEVPAEAPKA